MTNAGIVARLTTAQARRFRSSEPAQISAWEAQLALLRVALTSAPDEWHLLLEFDLLRLEKRIDAILLTDRAIFVLEFKVGATGYHAAHRRQAEDYALDLHDFHAGSRTHPVIPVLVATAAPAMENPPVLIWHGVAPVQSTNAAGLGALLRDVQQVIPLPHRALEPMAWLAAPYRPVPTIVEAARRLYGRHDVADIAQARADTINLTRTTACIQAAIARARAASERLVVFVTGIPGAGKTLCGLNVVFGGTQGPAPDTAFLTGNAPLVAVLREALAQDAVRAGGKIDPARRQVAGKLQNVHRFLEHYVERPAEIPDAHVVVFDEAQRAWDAAKACRDTQNRKSRLHMSEPAHMLEIMGRHPDWAVVVALIGSGQEINTGEAGLAEWGRAIAVDPRDWRAEAAPVVIGPGPTAQRVAPTPVPWLRVESALHLDVPIRAVNAPHLADWVDAVLQGDVAAAARIATHAELPVWLTRDLPAMRTGLKQRMRGDRRSGLVASSGHRRARADGLGAELHGDDAIVHWFLRRWPDVRASDALEVPASEYACQGLELDHVGLAWGGDFVRHGGSWLARRFSGKQWNRISSPDAVDYVKNTYRVLLTRARQDLIIWVPRGDAEDATRPPAEADALADFLTQCGARALATVGAARDKAVVGERLI